MQPIEYRVEYVVAVNGMSNIEFDNFKSFYTQIEIHAILDDIHKSKYNLI
jgi:hypothetical protein